MSQSYLKPDAAVVAVASGAAAIANNALAIANASANLTNATALDPFWGARLVAGFAVAPTQGSQIQLLLAPKFDGASPADVDTTTPYAPPNLVVGAFLVQLAQAGAQHMDIPLIPRMLLPYDYVPYLYNLSGQQITAGWSLTFYPARFQTTG